MSDGLVIVESPAKARTINRILDSSFSVQSSMGHIRDLPEKSFGVDLKNEFTPTYQVNKGRKNIIGSLNDAVKKAKNVYLATDPDREGEAIAWHLFELLKKKGRDAEFHRVTFHEITRQAVLNAFKHPEKLDMDRVNAQQARRILDRIVGYQVSPLLWKQIDRSARSAGRVQSAALRLICEREIKIRNFVPVEYWVFTALFYKFNHKDDSFSAKLHAVDDAKVEIDNEKDALFVYDDVLKGEYIVANVAQKPKIKRPSPPFITSTLQQAAGSNLRFGANRTMIIAQQLYEGIDTGNGPVGLITYMRTDSVNIAEEARKNAKEFITKAFGENFVPIKPNRYKSKQSAQEAHEAIRPTDISLTPEMAAKFLDRDQLRLYRLIWNRFIASQMAPAKLIQHTIDIVNKPGSCSKKYMFRATAVITQFPGYMRVYNLADIEVENAESLISKLPEMFKDDQCILDKLDKVQKFTEPPPRFTEATLVRELESNGIGRPSTYAAIVNTIQIRKYVDKEKGKLSPTSLGETVSTYLTKNLNNLFAVQFTAEMESELDAVESGKVEWKDMLDSFYKKFSSWVEEVDSKNVPESNNVNAVLNVFPDGFAWKEPTNSGIRKYDDNKFVTSLKKQIDSGKKLSDKQWQALLNVFVSYEEKIPDFSKIVAELDVSELISEIKQRRSEKIANQKPLDPNDISLRICNSLADIKNWEEPVKKGNRTYDDKKFFHSLNTQLNNGKVLSDAQSNALKNLLLKYRTQVSNYDDLKSEAKLPSDEEVNKSKEEIASLVVLIREVTEWKTVEKKGKSRSFDQQKFVESLCSQFKQKGRLSEKQVNSLKKVIRSKKDQIQNYEDKAAKLGL